MKHKIIVIGSINQDVVVQAPRIPSPGETVFGDELHYFPGGKGANQAVAAKLLGGDVTYFGKVGSDLFGRNLKKYMSTVDLGAAVERVDGSTGTAVIVVDGSGENAITVVPGANSEFSSGDLNILDGFGRGDFLLVQNEINVSFLYELIRNGRALDLTIVYNPAPAIETPADVLASCDYVIVNEHELETVFGTKVDLSNIEELKRRMLKTSKQFDTSIVLTLGANGCVAAREGAFLKSKGVKAEVVDTTGAGDCFCGAFVASLSEGKGLMDSLDFANMAGAKSVSNLGASSSFPKLEDLL